MSKVQKNEFNISGKVKHIIPPTSHGTQKFMKLVLIVWNGNKANEIEFSYYFNNMKLLENINPGDWVNIDFKLTGYKKTFDAEITRWFTNLVGISCNKQD